MKTILLIGSRNKADFALLTSHVIKNLEKKVLIVDATADQIYRYGYTSLSKKEYLYDFQGIDILCGAENWLQVEEKLRANNETTTNYDVVIVDMDSIQALTNEWPTFDERFYIGDEERLNQVRDVELLHRLFDETENTEMTRVMFEGRYRLDKSYFDNLMMNRAKWVSLIYSIEQDEFESDLRTLMQHELMIPFNKVSKQYREVLTDIVSGLFELHIEEINSAVKPRFFNFAALKKKKDQPQMVNSKY
jgi:hypothetical protein